MEKDYVIEKENHESENSMIREKLDEICRLLKKWEKGSAPLVGQIWLDKKTILKLLKVSESTLARWRAGEFGYKLPYELDSSGNAYYLFDTVYECLRTGKISARGFDRLEAMTRMKLYREDRVRELLVSGDTFATE